MTCEELNSYAANICAVQSRRKLLQEGTEMGIYIRLSRGE